MLPAARIAAAAAPVVLAVATAFALWSCASDPGAAPHLGDGADVTEEASPLEVEPIDDLGAADADADSAGGETDADGVCDTLGCPCARNDECASGYCVDGGARTGRICSELCSSACSLPDYDCVVLVTSGADAVQLCVPSWRSFCEPCTSDRTCGRLGDVCLELDDGTHCATDCSETGNCPPGGFCASVDVGGEVRSLCVPEDDICSPCFDEDSDGYGRGPECLGADCDDDNPEAHPGHAELCDGVDNDCDLFIDEDFDLDGDPANCGACGDACVGPRSVQTCDGGACVIGACDEGWVSCDGDPSTGCERAESDLNACGGCTALDGAPGDPCGACSAGALSCDGVDAVVCVGGSGGASEATGNACGGCGDLLGSPGDPCGVCGSGALGCDGEEALTCFGDAGEAARNACGGCGELEAAPGDPCGVCGSGALACDGSEALACAGDGGAAIRNACGGCGDLLGSPGDPCGTCGSGALACDGFEALACAGDGGADVQNACGGCGVLSGALGDPCGTCGSGALACDGSEALACAGDGGADAQNACGGCSTLPAAPGSACGPCLDGAWACDGADAVSCAGASADSDSDGVCDPADICAGGDDRVDTDSDGVPDRCDRCAGSNDAADADSDGVPDGCDRCAVGPDSADADGDSRPDACDCDAAGCSEHAACTEGVAGTSCDCVLPYVGDGYTCDLIDCGGIAAPTNGSISLTGTSYGSTATATCNTGWTLQGTSPRTCTEGGAWSGTPATCYRPPGNISCVCSGWYSVGSRVVAQQDYPPFVGSAYVGAGRMGTVLAGSTSGSQFALLVQFDNWSGGHSGRCPWATCGSCSEGGSSKYWVSCSFVAPAGP